MKHRISGPLLASLLPLALASPALAGCPVMNGSAGAWHFPNDFAAIYTVPIGTTGIWLPGSGTVHAPELEVPAGELSCLTSAPCLVNNATDDRAILDFERYEVEGDVFFAFAFSDGEKSEVLIPTLADEVALQGELAVQNVQLRHLVEFETYSDGGRRWSALFQEGVRNQSLELDLTGTQLKARVEIPPEVPPVNRHLVDFEVLTGLFGNPHYAALFDDGTADQQFFPSLTIEDFHQTVHDLHLLRFRLRELEVFKNNLGELRVAALFESMAGDNHLWVIACGADGDCEDDFEFSLSRGHLASRVAKFGELKPDLRMTNFELPRGGNETVIGSFGENDRPSTGRRISWPALEAIAEKGGTGPPTCNHAGMLHDAGTNGPP